MITIFTAVLHYTHPALSGLEALPHVLIDRWWHVGVPDDVVRAANQFCPSKATYRLKLIIAVENFSRRVCC